MYHSIRLKITHLAHALVHFQNKFTIYLSISRFRHPFFGPIQLERLGSDYGGWWVPKSSTFSSDRKILVSAGLGFDVSFDKLMLEDGYFVFGLDPLEKSFSFASEELKGYKNKLLLNKGVSTFDGRQKFYAPKIPSHDSWSISNSQATDEDRTNYFEVIAIDSLAIDFSDNSFVILKMDIEGGEESLIPFICKKGLKYDYLAIEMDCLSLISFFSLKKRFRQILVVRRLLSLLSNSGFRLIKNENFNFFWIHNQSFSKMSS
jgi:FkbM family methyltransferase